MGHIVRCSMKTKILLVGIDGLILKTALNSGRAPMLKSLMESGYFTPLTMDAPTLSGPGWSTLLTGSSHAQHAVVDNRFSGHNLLYCPDLLSRAYYMDQSTTTFAAAGWPPLVDPAGVGPVIHERREQARAHLHRVIARDGETYGYEKVDAEIATVAVFAMEKFGPDVSFVYFCDADEAGHSHGAIGSHYVQAIGRVDSHIMRLHSAIEDRVSRYKEEWLIVLTTDHGHVEEGGHGSDSPEERASFVIAKGIGRPNPQWPTNFAPEELAALILDERA
jgi:predicted AlkP superfamily pyrophosphatase or phosphodiesterase